MATTNKNHIKVLRDRHKEIIRLAVAGVDRKDISKHVGISVGQIKHVLNSPVAEEAIADAHRRRDAICEKVVTKMVERLPKAADTLQEIMDDPEAPAASRVAAAKQHLEVAGLGGKTEKKVVVGLAPETMQLLRERAALARRGLPTGDYDSDRDRIEVDATAVTLPATTGD